MRPYRAIPIDSKDFVYGGLCKISNNKSYIVLEEAEIKELVEYGSGTEIWGFVEVIPETVGQQVSLKDKNGKEGYKDDIVSFGSTRPMYLIKWSICNAGFYLESMDEQKGCLGIINFTVGEIVGDIHTTPELMEK